MPPTPIEESIELSWRDYWAIVQRRRWWLAGSVFLAWAIVWVASWFLPKTYRSETLILIEAPRIPQQYVVPNIASDIQDRLQSLSQQILSRTRLLRVIEESNLYPEMQTHSTTDDILVRMRQDIVVELVQGPTQRQDVTAFKISYTAPNPQLAQHVTGELTRLFIDENLKIRQEQSENTTEFLQNQLELARAKLAEQETRVRDFKSRYQGELPAQLQSSLQILGGVQSQFQAELADLNRAEQQNLYLKSLAGQYRSIQAQLRRGGGSAELPPALDQELHRLKTQLNELHGRYTDQHPDVRKLREQIAATEQMKRQMENDNTAAAHAEDTPVTTMSDLRNASPLIEVESQLRANELDIQNRKQRVARLTAQVAAYETRLNQIPLREQQMADLTRDYEQSRAQYESLLAKKNQSELATNLEKQQQGEQFRVLDPPSLPQKPYSPNRLKLSFRALAAGAFLGLVITVLLEFTAGCIRREQEVRAVVPACSIFETIPRLATRNEEGIERRRLWAEVVAGTVMTATLALAMFFTYRNG